MGDGSDVLGCVRVFIPDASRNQGAIPAYTSITLAPSALS